jgi:hypothetical protein
MSSGEEPSTVSKIFLSPDEAVSQSDKMFLQPDKNILSDYKTTGCYCKTVFQYLGNGRPDLSLNWLCPICLLIASAIPGKQ